MGRGAALQEAQTYIRTLTLGELRTSELGQAILKELHLEAAPDSNNEDCPLAHPFYWGAWVCQGETTAQLLDFSVKKY